MADPITDPILIIVYGIVSFLLAIPVTIIFIPPPSWGPEAFGFVWMICYLFLTVNFPPG